MNIDVTIAYLLILHVSQWLPVFMTVDKDFSFITDDFQKMLQEHLADDGLFDEFGSLDVAVMKKDALGREFTVYQKAFGMAQHELANDVLSEVKGKLITPGLKMAVENIKSANDLPALNMADKRNLYRIGSLTKAIVGIAALIMKKRYDLNLHEKVSPKYIDLSSLGSAHNWGKPSEKDGYITRYFPNSTEYSSKITFRQLLSHTSGLSREPKKGDLYPFGGSRTDTPICPPAEPEINLDEIKGSNLIKQLGRKDPNDIQTDSNGNNPNGNNPNDNNPNSNNPNGNNPNGNNPNGNNPNGNNPNGNNPNGNNPNGNNPNGNNPNGNNPNGNNPNGNNPSDNNQNKQDNQNNPNGDQKTPKSVENQKEPPKGTQTNQNNMNNNQNEPKPQVNMDGTNKTISEANNNQGSDANNTNGDGSKENPPIKPGNINQGTNQNQNQPMGKHENPNSVENQKEPTSISQNDFNTQNSSQGTPAYQENLDKSTPLSLHRRDLNSTVSDVRQNVKSKGIKVGFPPRMKQVGYPPLILNGGLADPNVIDSSLDEKILGKKNARKLTHGGKNKNDLDERILGNKKNKNGGNGNRRKNSRYCNPEVKEKNWLVWTKYIIPYMMPACGYKKYNEHSTLMSCLPGTYFHNSNAGYSILAYALNSYLLQMGQPPLEEWIQINIFKPLGMNDTVFTWADLTMEQKSRTAHGCNLGKNYKTCDPKRPITDFADRGYKGMSSGMWSTVGDLAHFQLRLKSLVITKDVVDVSNIKTDHASEGDDGPTKPRHEQYNFGFYLNTDYTCTRSVKGMVIHSVWGDVPGYSSFMATNLQPRKTSAQYAVVILRTQNYEKRIRIGNQGRRLLWRLLHPTVPRFKLKCPVVAYDSHKNGDMIIP